MPSSSQNPTPEPMPDERFAEIRNRRFAEITPGPWLVSEDGDGSPVVYVEHQPTAGLAYARVLLTADYATEQDVQFVASARRSVPELVAEVERLRSEVTRLRAQRRYLLEQVRRKGAASGDANRALAEFLAEDSEPEVPRTERSRWQAIADALNAVPALGVDLDGTVTDRLAWSVVWDREAERWVVAGYDDDTAAAARDAQTGGVS